MNEAGPVPDLATNLKPKWLALLAVAVLVGLVLRAAWVNDDAYITLRTLDNWVSGHGLRWNPRERVQSYTHPLWLFVLAVPYSLTRHGYFSLLSAGVATTLLAGLVLVKSARSAGHALVAVLLLLLSRSFLEYSTSGLENPLTHLLLAVFVWLYVVREAPLRDLTLCASLLALNRIDSLILALPALAHAAFVAWRAHGPRRTLYALALGASPLLAWEAFSIFYYGAFVPNTALAKLHTGLSAMQLARQGFVYVLGTLAWDPALFIVVAAAITIGFAQRRLRPALIALGALLYLVYVLRVGGDFMIGRFMTPPLFVAVCLLAVSPLPLEDPGKAVSALAPLLLLSFLPLAVERYPVGDLHHSGIVDERAYYRDYTALMLFKRNGTLPNHPWSLEGGVARARNVKVMQHFNIGFLGYAAGPRVHIVDMNALSEPLLARLPPYRDRHWRVGHYQRHVPEGYVESIESGVCKLTDRKLCVYYAHLREVISGDLFSLRRIGEIVWLNAGAYDHLIDVDRYRYPGIVREQLAALSAGVRDGAAFDSPGTRVFPEAGLAVTLGTTSHARRLRISFDGNDGYEVVLTRDGERIESLEVSSLEIGGMQTRELQVSARSADEGYDRILMLPSAGDGRYSAGFIRLLGE